MDRNRNYLDWLKPMRDAYPPQYRRLVIASFLDGTRKIYSQDLPSFITPDRVKSAQR